MTGPFGPVAAMVDDDCAKRDLMVRWLNQMPGVRCALPAGTIYAFSDVRATGHSSQALAERLPHEAHVVAEAGSFCGAGGEGNLRLCFGSETMQRIDLALDRMSRFFNAL